MTIYYSPFIIALFIHIFIVVSTGLLIDKPSDNFISVSKNLINVNFNSGGSSAGRVGDKIVKKLNVSNSKTIQENGPVLESNSGSSVGTNDVHGTGSRSGAGSGSGTTSSESSGLGSGISFGEAVTSFKEPAYPRLALRRGIEGSLKIKIMITPEGLPQEIIILTSSGHEILDQAAIDAVKVWTFASQAKPYFVLKTIVFQIKN